MRGFDLCMMILFCVARYCFVWEDIDLWGRICLVGEDDDLYGGILILGRTLICVGGY